MMYQKTALVLEGGGFRGIFTAGILEVFLENRIFFESVYGVSAGAAYGVSYASEQLGRNLAVNDLINDKRYCSWNNWLRKGSIFDWDFVYEEVPQKMIPFDYDTLQKTESKFYVGTSDCKTGKAEFYRLNKADKKEFKTILAASSSLPFISPMVQYDGKILMDGGLADSIPFEYALNTGLNRAVIILTQPEDYAKAPLKYPGIFKWYYRKYPKVYEMLVSRARRYNADIRKIAELEKSEIVFVIRPEKAVEIKRIENNPQKTASVYHRAMAQARRLLPELENWLQQ